MALIAIVESWPIACNRCDRYDPSLPFHGLTAEL